MSHQVLARKWRPKAFSEVVGQDHVVMALTNALDTGRIHHAYLFTGTRGVGKTTLARILAKALNCQGVDGNGGITSKPCGACRACMEIDAGRFVDLLEVDAATNTKVDEMRELLESAQYMPVSGRYKVYIIDEVHMLSRSAFNSMLKTLEEPPDHVEFILATTDPQKLPVTVLSRCLQFNLKQLPPTLLAGHLKRVLESEGVPYEESALAMLGKAAEGSVRDSLSLLDQAIAHGGGSVNADGVSGMLGALDQGYLFALLERLARRDAQGIMQEVDRMAERSLSFDMALRDLAGLLHRIAILQSIPQAVAGMRDDARVTALSAALSPEDVQLFYQISILGRRDLNLAPDEQSGFSMSMLRMLAFSPSVNTNVPGNAESLQSSHSSPAATQPVDAASPRASTASVTASGAEQVVSSTVTFNGDWAGLVARLNLAGMAGMLAKQCELVSVRENVLELMVPEAQKHLLDKVYQDKLKAELAPHLPAKLRINIRAGTLEGKSLAAIEHREREALQAKALAAIESDAFVRDLMTDFGAEINPASIKPVP
jgi:DNA polymerase III subunit gamma/tau